MSKPTWHHVCGLAALGLLSRPTAAAALDATGYDSLLRRHVQDGRVDYRALGDRNERAVLKRFLAEVAHTPLSAVGNRHDQLAAAINAYNALVIDHVLDGHSPSTIWGRAMFFFRASWRVFGRTLTLDHLEQRIIRQGFAEPRVHFALVCASTSCPPLRPEAYVGERLSAQLDDQGRRFVNDPARNRFDSATRTLSLSMIFRWYRQDFAAVAGSVPGYLVRFAPPETGEWIGKPGVTVRHLPYDWSLNGTL